MGRICVVADRGLISAKTTSRWSPKPGSTTYWPQNCVVTVSANQALGAIDDNTDWVDIDPSTVAALHRYHPRPTAPGRSW